MNAQSVGPATLAVKVSVRSDDWSVVLFQAGMSPWTGESDRVRNEPRAATTSTRATLSSSEKTEPSMSSDASVLNSSS